jgi:type IV pilus assembly protein PilW
MTLVELMVALAIGLFIVLVATTIYVQGLSSFGFRVGQSENLGNSRQALAVLDSEFSKAGYRRDPSQLLLDAFPADPMPYPNGCQFAQGQALYAADAQTICLRFQPRDAAETDCAGTPANLGAAGPYDAPAPAPAPAVGAGMFVEKYTIENGALVCRAAQEVVPVADGVRAVHFEFGVDQQTAPGAIRRVDAFTGALPAAQESIRALRFAILLESSGKVTQGMASTVCERWAALGGAAGLCDANAGPLLQLATGTLSLRNLMP